MWHTLLGLPAIPAAEEKLAAVEGKLDQVTRRVDELMEKDGGERKDKEKLELWLELDDIKTELVD